MTKFKTSKLSKANKKPKPMIKSYKNKQNKLARYIIMLLQIPIKTMATIILTHIWHA